MNETKEEVKNVQYDEVPEKKKVVRTDSYFDGKLLELIGYRILGCLIILFTFGLASAWAEKLIIAYKIEHTVYNGKRLKFEGTGASLFVQMFKWIFLSIITLGIYSLWIPLKKENWIYSNTHFEDEDFIKGDSYFDGGLLGLIGVNLFTSILTIISFGLLYPFVICYKQKWLAKHTIINRKRLTFKGTSLSLVGHYLLWWLLTLITFGIFGLWLPIKIWQWQTKHTHLKLKDEIEPKTSVVPAIIAIVVGIIMVSIVIYGIGAVYTSLENGSSLEELFSEDLELNLSSNRKQNMNSMSAAQDQSVVSLNNQSISNNKNNQSNVSATSKYTTKDFHRNTRLTLVDGVLCYGYSDHSRDVYASIVQNGDIAIEQGLGAILIENANAKYLYKVSKIAADNVDLYFITNNNELYVIRNVNASTYNQPKVKASNNRVKEFLGTTSKNNGEYLKVLLENGSVEEVLYLEYLY